jgi:FkbM family methyltransferase
MKYKLFFKAAFTKISLFWANLPYNLNWLRKDWKEVDSFLDKNPITIADIGARGGELGELISLKKYLNYYGFDADTEAAENLENIDKKGFKDLKIFPFFVGEDNKKIDFNLYKLPAQSSVFKPNKRFKDIFGGPSFGIEKTFEVESKSLDRIILDSKNNFPDMIKLDTQGNELDILKASPESMKNVLLIETEVEFTEIYKGQYLFHDVMKFMYENGFELLNLNRVYHNRDSYHGESKGQIIWGDALFGKREDKLHTFSEVQIAKYIILLINYGHLDFAHYLCQNFPKAYNLIPNISKYFKLFSGSLFSKLRRVVIFQFDKFLSLMLLMRKTNKNIYDDDRSFPKR